MTRSQLASALGKLGAGHKKTMSDAAKAQRRAAGVASGKARKAAKKGKHLDAAAGYS